MKPSLWPLGSENVGNNEGNQKINVGPSLGGVLSTLYKYAIFGQYRDHSCLTQLLMDFGNILSVFLNENTIALLLALRRKLAVCASIGGWLGIGR